MTDDETVVGRIMAAQNRLQQLFAYDRSDPLFASQLTVPQLKMLLVLSLRGGASGQELAAIMGVRLATLTGIVDRLVAHHLVTRREDPRDRRVRRVELSPAGDRLIQGIITAGAQRHRRLLDRLDADELQVVRQALELLVRAAEQEAAGDSGGPARSGQVERAGGGEHVVFDRGG